MTVSCEKHLTNKAKLNRVAEQCCRELVPFDEFEYTMDSVTSISKPRQRTEDTVKVGTELHWDLGCREGVGG